MGSGGSQDECDRRIEIFVKIPNKKFGRGVGLGGGSGWISEVFVKFQKNKGFRGGWARGRQCGSEQRIEVFMKIQKKKSMGGGGSGLGMGVRVDVNEEVKFL